MLTRSCTSSSELLTNIPSRSTRTRPTAWIVSPSSSASDFAMTLAQSLPIFCTKTAWMCGGKLVTLLRSMASMVSRGSMRCLEKKGAMKIWITRPIWSGKKTQKREKSYSENSPQIQAADRRTSWSVLPCAFNGSRWAFSNKIAYEKRAPRLSHFSNLIKIRTNFQRKKMNFFHFFSAKKIKISLAFWNKNKKNLSSKDPWKQIKKTKFDWCIDWFIGWFIDWLVDWLVDWFIDDSLVDSLIDWLIDWLIDFFCLGLGTTRDCSAGIFTFSVRNKIKNFIHMWG